MVDTPLADGMIGLDSERGKVLGFTSDKFDGYLWKLDGAILISFIESKKRGNFRKLVETIRSMGLAVKIPTPLGRMQDIVVRNGYRHTMEEDKELGESFDVWVLDSLGDRTRKG